MELSRLYTVQDYLGRGIGPALLEACIAFSRRMAVRSLWLASWKENRRANAFYTKMRFDIVGTQTFVLGADIQEDYVFAKSIRSRRRGEVVQS
jgi:ribosomal protein S18 acetylase RimI-like enzyme